MYRLNPKSAKPPYLQVKEMLCDEIAEGRIAVGGTLPKERSLAEDLGLSRMTVRRAIVELAEEGLVRRVRGQGTFVEPGAPSAGRRALGRGTGAATLAFVSNQEQFEIRSSIFYYRVFQGIQSATDDHGISVAFRKVRAPAADFVRELAAGGVDGVIALGVVDRELIEMLAGTGMPTVLVDCVGPAGPAGAAGAAKVDRVGADCEGAARDAVNALVRLGHRDITMMTFEGETEVVLPRRLGYERAVSEHGLERDVVSVSISIEGGYAAMRRLLRRERVPTAVFSAADCMALGAMTAARENGMSIPADLSVVGFGDVGYFSAPPLSTVRIPVEQMGVRAVELLRERCDDPALPGREVYLPSEWLPRSTCDVPRCGGDRLRERGR